MLAGGHVVDGSWNLSITVTDLPQDVTLRVKGDLHIGGVMLRLVEELNVSLDWSDHALWWPHKRMWLLRTRSTLDQYNVQADAHIWFTPMHKNLRVQLPDLQVMDMRVNFSSNVFSNVIKLCKEFGIRHPEELSLARRLDREELKRNSGASATRKTRPQGLASPGHHMSNNSLEGNVQNSPYRMNPNTPQGTLMRTTPGTPGSPYNTGTLGHSPYVFNANGTLSPGSMHSLSFEGALESTIANSPVIPAKEALLMLYKPKNFAEKARINAGWLDSSRSLFEQDIVENDLVFLRFKFFSFYDLNPKYDAIRINQIYEQAKWSLIAEEIDCTEEEMMMFAALQMQVQLQVHIDQPDLDGSASGAVDEIDAALTDLQVSLEGSSTSAPSDITKIPELQDELRFFKPKKFTFKSFKRYFFTFRDTYLSMYRSANEADQPPLLKLNLKGCEVTPDVNISAQRYNMKLFVTTADGMTECWLRAFTEEQYANWMAAFRLASKGKTMADSVAYDQEKSSIQVFLSMQHPVPVTSVITSPSDFQPEDFVAPRFIRKLKSKQVAQRILEAHANVREMNLMESKLRYIKAWQALPEYGITYFICRFVNPHKGELSKKEELLGIASNRMLRMDLNTGDTLKTLRFPELKTWSVNWEIKQVRVTFELENIDFQCVTADCKVVHEFIGGYIFLSMRSGDKNQALNEELFHKLTGGWD